MVVEMEYEVQTQLGGIQEMIQLFQWPKSTGISCIYGKVLVHTKSGKVGCAIFVFDLPSVSAQTDWSSDLTSTHNPTNFYSFFLLAIVIEGSVLTWKLHIL